MKISLFMCESMGGGVCVCVCWYMYMFSFLELPC